MRLLRLIWRLLVGIKDALVLLFMLLFFGLLYAALSERGGASVPSGGALTLDLAGVIVDQPSEQPPLALLSGRSDLVREIRTRDVVHAVNAAAGDGRIKALVLDLDRFQGAGHADLQSIGGALKRFRSAGKPIYSYAASYNDAGYYLASYANEVWMAPLGGVLLTGPGGANLYYKGLLDKLAVDVEVFRVGTYKSAVEPFVRQDQSPEAKAAAQSLVDMVWASWKGDVTRARPRARIESYITDLPALSAASGGDPARTAVAAGLVDRLGSRSDFARKVAQLVGPGPDKTSASWSGVKLADYARSVEQLAPSSGPGVGVVYVAGEIVDGDAGPGSAGGDTIAELVEKALTDRNIKALVVRIDSPGGSVMASERIRLALMEARRRNMPVIASMGSVAASGGYWVATSADTIFAEPSTITGSIGVFAIVPSFQNTLAKAGLSADGVKSTPYSGEPDVLRGLSPELKTLMQMSVEDIYKRFITRVSLARKLSPQRVDEIGQGRVWAGAAARRLGLVDHFGGLDAAVAEAARRAGIDPGKPRMIYIEKQPSLPFQLLGDMLTDAAPAAASASDPWSGLIASSRGALLQAFSDAEAVARGPAVQARCLECGFAAAPRASSNSDVIAKLLAVKLK